MVGVNKLFYLDIHCLLKPKQLILILLHFHQYLNLAGLTQLAQRFLRSASLSLISSIFILLQKAYLLADLTRPEMNFRANNQSKLKFTKNFSDYFSHL